MLKGLCRYGRWGLFKSFDCITTYTKLSVVIVLSYAKWKLGKAMHSLLQTPPVFLQTPRIVWICNKVLVFMSCMVLLWRILTVIVLLLT